MSHSTFLAVASHDLRGRLANVRSYASLLLGPRMALEPKARKSVEVIARNADAALALAQDVFDLLRAESGVLRLEPETGPVRPLLDEALAKALPLAEERQVRLAPLEHPELPDVPCDPDRLRRSALGLLRHGIERSEAGRTVGLDAVVSEGWLRVSAWDEAAPLNGSAAQQAFDLDARLNDEKRLAGGFELALGAALTWAQGGRSGGFVDDAGHQHFFFELPLSPTRNDRPDEPR